jgi:hypothetical protein
MREQFERFVEYLMQQVIACELGVLCVHAFLMHVILLKVLAEDDAPFNGRQITLRLTISLC